jgi:hypothetical protein
MQRPIKTKKVIGNLGVSPYFGMNIYSNNAISGCVPKINFSSTQHLKPKTIRAVVVKQ